MRFAYLVGIFGWLVLLVISGCARQATVPVAGNETPAMTVTSDQSPGTDLDSLNRTRKLAVEENLKTDLELASFNIEVEVKGGTVILSGQVDSDDQAQRAGELAGRTRGITRVENRIVIPVEP